MSKENVGLGNVLYQHHSDNKIPKSRKTYVLYHPFNIPLGIKELPPASLLAALEVEGTDDANARVVVDVGTIIRVAFEATMVDLTPTCNRWHARNKVVRNMITNE